MLAKLELGFKARLQFPEDTRLHWQDSSYSCSWNDRCTRIAAAALLVEKKLQADSSHCCSSVATHQAVTPAVRGGYPSLNTVRCIQAKTSVPNR